MTGFKSFAARTVLEFRPGIMAVVGPNGCGKTNIVDAVRWVLGEQRSGALRAERMESVIFAGTAKRRPLGMAEVTLTLDNDKGILPAPYSEVALTRRLFRSGESEYLINRDASRLRDIQALFTDTGLGPHTYSIMELPMVDGIISGSHEARRGLVEEAAGISHYKSRRAAAESRLKTTRESLLRINDLFLEVEKSYGTLKRQASRAKRHQSLQRALELRLLVELAAERLRLVEIRDRYSGRLAEIESEASRVEAELTRTTAEVLALESKDLILNDRIGRGLDATRKLERREAELEGELALVRQRLEHLEARRAADHDRRTTLKARLESLAAGDSEGDTLTLTEDLTTREAEYEQLTALSREMAAQLASAREAYDRTRRAFHDLEQSLASARETARQTAARRSALERDLTLVVERHRPAVTRLEVVSRDLQSAKSDLRTRQEEATASRDAVARLQTEFAEREQAGREAQTKLRGAASALEAARSEVESLEVRLMSAASLPTALHATLASRELRSLASRLECQEEDRTALAAALRPILEALEADSPDEGFGWIRAAREGALVVQLPLLHEAPPPPPLSLPDGADAVPASEAVRNDGAFGTFLKHRLGRTLIVKDVAAIERLSGWAAKNRVCLVGRDGVILDPDGILRREALDPESLRVGWNARLREAKKRLSTAQNAAEVSGKSFQTASAAQEQAAEALDKARRRLRDAADRLDQTGRQVVSLIADKDLLERQIAEASHEEERLRRLLEELPPLSDDANGIDDERLAQLRQDFDAAAERLSNIEQEQGSLADRRDAAAAERARLGERIAAQRSAVVRTELERREIGTALGHLEAGFAGLESEITQTRQALESLSGQLDLLKSEKSEESVRLETNRQERDAVKRDRDRLNAALKQLQDQQKSLASARTDLELEAVSSRERLREIDRRLTEDARIDPDSITAETTAQAQMELDGMELGSLSVDQIKVRMQSVGPVNMLALEELKDVEERYKFLGDQKKDLESGIELLEETITRINSEARRRLRETFDRIDRHFQDLFRSLFEGGEARLSLVGDDPLEADVRIWATPTGKKMQSLSMLSGGEKALTAIAFLFAIYRERPSPFCILDEVDAPLDDANIGRFNRIVRRFSTDTQFLIVTHNKRTMEAADCLFGVTLNDDGTSRLVSVKIEENGYPATVPARKSDE
ncbi:MAG: chromosome segregation protein SMC [Calditrichaeota bacterium]|nr:chromosome segregation protein SMC [Calditrichota bacterium]